MLVYLNIFLKDTGERETSALVETDLTESELQKEIDKIERESATDDYSIDDILKKLEIKGLITLLNFDHYEIEM